MAGEGGKRCQQSFLALWSFWRLFVSISLPLLQFSVGTTTDRFYRPISLNIHLFSAEVRKVASPHELNFSFLKSQPQRSTLALSTFSKESLTRTKHHGALKLGSFTPCCNPDSLHYSVHHSCCSISFLHSNSNNCARGKGTIWAISKHLQITG